MGVLEIILLAAGAVIFVASFCIPVRQEKLKEEAKNLAADEVKSLVADELENVRGKLTELSEEEMQQRIEKTERSMERISNEKIMAVNEYSDTVLEEIHKNHEEVVFLYDMLKNKKESLSESFGRADQDLQEILQQVKDSEITVQENLKELSENLKELEKKKAEIEDAVRAAAKQKEAAAEREKERILEERTEAAEPEAESVPSRAETLQAETVSLAEETMQKESGQEKEMPLEKPEAEKKEIPLFQPFTVEKVEAVPKKKVVQKAAESPARQMAAPVRAEEDVMLLLSDTTKNSPAENSNGRILELHKAGKSNMAIARELGLGIGEVKLVIDLYEGMR